ncbi:MAG: IS1634 family transposase [Acidobacteriota bacterium]
MYIESVPNRNSPPAILLRESVREGAQVRKRTLANLSAWAPARVEALRRALRGDFDQLSGVEPTCGPVYGVLYALKAVADALGLSAVLGRQRTGKLGLFLILARVALQGSRLSAVRWARDHAVVEVLGLGAFDEDDLYGALEDLGARQEQIEQRLYARYVKGRAEPPILFLYDVTSTYLEGEHNELAEFGYNRDGKRGKLQIVVGLLTDAEGEPLAVRVFSGSRADPTTVADQIEILKKRFQVEVVVFVGDRGMIKSTGKAALSAAGMRYITALTDPQIRKLLKRGTLQLGLFEEKICEVEADRLRYILRKNEAEAREEEHRREDKLAKLETKIAARNAQVSASPRCQPEAGRRQLREWVQRYKLAAFVALELDERKLRLAIDEAAREQAGELAGCYVIETDVPKPFLEAQTAHDRYKDLGHLEQELRTLKTGLLEIRPVFVRKEARTRGHVFVCFLALKISREMHKRLARVFGATDADRYAVTLKDALAALHRLCLTIYPVKENVAVPVLPRPDETQTKILEALNVPLPKKSKM